MQSKRAVLVSFSGIDGAGKSTQIGMLRICLAQAGISTRLLTFWDDGAMLSRFRERCSLALFKGDKGVGTPEKPINRRDKNVQSGAMTLARLVFYLLDALHLCFVVANATRSGDAEVVIFDRYIYDELANLPLDTWYGQSYVRFLLWLVPQPDIAYLIDADCRTAWQRKPEYPYEFLEHNRKSYLALSEKIPEMKIIAPSSMCEMQWKLVEEMVDKLPRRKREFFCTAKALIES